MDNPIGASDLRSYLDWAIAGKSGIARYLLGLIIAVFVFFLLAGFGLIPLALLYPGFDTTVVGKTLALLLPFAIPFFLLPIILGALHARPYWSIAMPSPGWRWWDLSVGFWTQTIVGLVVLFLSGAFGMVSLRYNGFNVQVLVPLAIVAFFGIFIQAGAEEILFRGYLGQMVRRFTSNPYLIIGVQTLLFALPHMGNLQAYQGNPLVLMPYVVSGALYGWLAWYSGSLWMSLGAHWANNFSNSVLTGTDGDILPTAAPIIISLDSIDVVAVLTLAQAVLIVGIVVFLVRRRAAA